MLVLARHISESIQIGPDIRLTIVDVYGAAGHKRVRIGIEAPPDVSVVRQELEPLRFRQILASLRK